MSGPCLAALLARALRAQGRTDEALSSLAEAEERRGPSSALAAERVLALGMGGRVEAGIGVAREALARHSSTSIAKTRLMSSG